MSISTEITRIQAAKADIRTAIEGNGVTVPSSAKIDSYASYVSQIETGGGSGSDYEQQFIDLIERDITSMTIPNGTKSIGFNAFSHCGGLTSVTIPDSVTSIGLQAFSQCSRLTSVTIPNTVTSIGNHAFQQCTSLTSITIPDSVTTIGQNVFQFCSKLKSVSIGNGVTKINEAMFQYCSSLTNITIPSSVTSIEDGAFQSCGGLTSVTILATTPPTLGTSAFYNTNANLVIYVPAASVDAYKAAANWSAYADRIQAITE